jgi:hypothetical protein
MSLTVIELRFLDCPARVPVVIPATMFLLLFLTMELLSFWGLLTGLVSSRQRYTESLQNFGRDVSWKYDLKNLQGARGDWCRSRNSYECGLINGTTADRLAQSVWWLGYWLESKLHATSGAHLAYPSLCTVKLTTRLRLVATLIYVQLFLDSSVSFIWSKGI